MLPCIRKHDDGAILAVQAVPRASRTEIVDFTSERCKIRVKAPPVDGEANTALSSFLAKLLRIPKRSVRLLRGQRGRSKSFLLEGITPQDLEKVLTRIFRQ